MILNNFIQKSIKSPKSTQFILNSSSWYILYTFRSSSSCFRYLLTFNSLKKNFKYHLIGIRPGEKIHETLCPQDSARDTIEFKKYFIIRPNFDFSQGKSKNYLLSKSKEIGKKVSDNFIYSSDQNTHFLSVNEIKKLNN